MSVATESDLLPTTIEKDHALGWVLMGIARHPVLGRWIFKGGTCLKKCYFDTYRFSEDLDFTMPDDLTADTIAVGLRETSRWVSDASGLRLPEDGIEVLESVNKQGQATYQAKLAFQGPLGLPRSTWQRIKFDLTHHELLGAAPVERHVFHPYSDRPQAVPLVRCYALEEILAEKTRALVQRAGRARDVYDVVNISRNFRELVDVPRARGLAVRKFEFKGLPIPTPEGILVAIQRGVLAVDWENALRHQIRVLPPVDEFLNALREALRWLLLPEHPVEVLPQVPSKLGEARIPALNFAAPKLGSARTLAGPASVAAALHGSKMDRIRFAARNRLLARVNYEGVNRLVEPYSLRRPATGNLLLYVYEVQRGGSGSASVKAFKVDRLGDVDITDQAFRPRFLVEL